MLQTSYIKNISALVVCQALFFMANTIVISTAPLVGLQYAPSPAWSTVPLGMQFIGTMSMTMPASFLMQRIGRRYGLALGMTFAIMAGLLGIWAIYARSFGLLCLTGVVYGCFSAFAQYLRFTAADVADASPSPDRAAARARAISFVMIGGVVAGVLGPELADRTRDLLAPVVFAGCYLAIASLGIGALLAILFLDLPLPTAAERRGEGRPLAQIARQPAARVAFLAALVGYVTMNLLMTATPLAMVACGHSFVDTKHVIQWHVLGMFVPSFFTGKLITRFGVERIVLWGIALNLVCIAVAIAGVDVANFAASLFLLGVGWNFMFVGGTTLLTTCHSAGEKAKVQGLNDFLVFTSVAASASLSGLLHATIGWAAMNLFALPALVIVGLVVALRARALSAAPAT